jgi:amylovoran biosynthesis glycosyltransferase AmsE
VQVGGYPLFKKAQDYALWSVLINDGYEMENVQEVLVKMRAGTGLLERRGIDYLIQEIKLLKFQKNIGFLTINEFLRNYMIRTLVRTSPNFFKRIAYKIVKSI